MVVVLIGKVLLLNNVSTFMFVSVFLIKSFGFISLPRLSFAILVNCSSTKHNDLGGRCGSRVEFMSGLDCFCLLVLLEFLFLGKRCLLKMPRYCFWRGGRSRLNSRMF